MRRVHLTAAAAALAVAAAGPAAADILFFAGDFPFAGEDDITLDGGVLDGVVSGVGATTGGTLAFTAGEDIAATTSPTGIAPSDGSFTSFTVAATGGYSLTGLILDLRGLGIAEVTVHEVDGATAGAFNFSVGTGLNYLTIQAQNGQRIASVDFTAASGVFTNVNNPHAGFDASGVTQPVPEPAAWALMLAGLGLAGAALRRRSVAA